MLTCSRMSGLEGFLKEGGLWVRLGGAGGPGGLSRWEQGRGRGAEWKEVVGLAWRNWWGQTAAREGPAASPEPFPSCQICEEFRSISRKIYEKPNSIEELAELREWMKGVPEKLVGLEVRRAHWELEEQEPGSWD